MFSVDRVCTPGIWLGLTAAFVRGYVDYGSYEVMTGRVGSQGEKGVEYKDCSEYWVNRMQTHEYKYVVLYAGRCLSSVHSCTVWDLLGWSQVDLRVHVPEDLSFNRETNELKAGTYSNGYFRRFVCTSGKIIALRLGEIRARHFTGTDSKTWQNRAQTKKGYTLIRKKEYVPGVCVGCS